MWHYRASFYSHNAEGSEGYKEIATFSNNHVQGQKSTMDDTRQISKPSLLLALVKAFGVSFAQAGFLKFISDLLNFVGPQVLKSVTFVVMQYIFI